MPPRALTLSDDRFKTNFDEMLSNSGARRADLLRLRRDHHGEGDEALHEAVVHGEAAGQAREQPENVRWPEAAESGPLLMPNTSMAAPFYQISEIR